MADTQTTLGFFGLREQPFAPTADPVYFFATRAHKECLFRLWNTVDNRHGIAVVLGNYGTGKTTLLRKLIVGMAAEPQKYNTAIVGSPIPSWTSFALLESIVLQFGLHPEPRSFGAYMEALNQYVLARRDHISTLIIDDAQNLNKRGQIELLRLIQNLETPQYKLLNLVLFAQMEWMEVLKAAPNFEQRVNMTFTLPLFTRNEIAELIQFRIRQAIANPNLMPSFSDSAVDVIHAYTEGNPRVAVTLCRNALLVAERLKTRTIGQDVILHTIEKTTVPDTEKRARAAAAAVQPKPMAASEPAPPLPAAEGGPIAAHKDMRDARAAQMLLRAARARQNSGNE